MSGCVRLDQGSERCLEANAHDRKRGFCAQYRATFVRTNRRLKQNFQVFPEGNGYIYAMALPEPNIFQFLDFRDFMRKYFEHARLEDEGYGPILREAGLSPDLPDEALRVPLAPAGAGLEPEPVEAAR